MSRLMQKDEQGNWCLKGLEWEQLHVGQVITPFMYEKLYGELWNLMEYEDTGLTPECIEELNEFEKTQTAHYLAALQEEQRKHRWIPVEERLPEDDTDMIVCKADGIIDMAFWDGYYWRSMTTDFTIDVCAWMPLPEPFHSQN